MEAVERRQIEGEVSGKRSRYNAKDLTVTLANFRSARQLGKKIFCDNKAEESPALYLHNIYY